MPRFSFALFVASLHFCSTQAGLQPPETVDIGTRLEPFVDNFLIDQLTGAARLELKAPRDEGIAVKLNAPWEKRFCGYTTVIKDGDLYRMYYRGLPEIEAAQVTCYAESRDGRKWYKPAFAIHCQSRCPTNILLRDVGSVTHNFCPFLDKNPAKGGFRFKAIGGSAETGLFGYQSHDGIHWQPIGSEPVLKLDGWVFDSQNVCFWSAEEGQYVMYFRRAIDGVRAIAKSTSADFLHWTLPRQMTYSDTGSERPSQQLYTNQTQPYFRAPHLLIATAARFMPGRRVINSQQAEQIAVDPRYSGDLSDAILMTSRGGTRYDLSFDTALLKPGIGAENWVSRTNYPALGIVPTSASEMSLYVNQNYGQPTAHVRRYSFRTDGLACVAAPLAGGEMVTRPFVMSGDTLQLNFATSAAGAVQVEIQDMTGKALASFMIDQCLPMIGNEIARTVHWTDGVSTARLKGTPIRLRIRLEDAELYSLRFAGSGESR